MYIEYISPHNNYNGYGMAEKHLIKYLKKVGINLQRKVKNPEISLIHAPAPAIANAHGKIKVLYTMIEGTETPPSWIPFLKQADYVVTPSKFCQDVFKKAGIESIVIPLGYDPEVFKPVKRKIDPDKPFTVLHYEAFQDRKGWEELLDAWTLSLYDQEFGVRLILKTIKKYDEIPERVSDFHNNIEVVTGKLPQHCLFDLLKEADLFVFPSRGEGFSHPPIEAMATGCPVILTKGHAHMDFYDERYMYGVNIAKEIPSDYPGWEKVGNFVRCNVDHLADRMYRVYNNRKEAIDKGNLAVSYVEKYSYKNIALQWLEFFNIIK